MDRMQQAEILGKLFSAESGTFERAKPPETAEVSRPCRIIGPRPCYWNASPTWRKLARFGDGTASEELKSFPGSTTRCSLCDCAVDRLKSARSLPSSSSCWKGAQPWSEAAQSRRRARPAMPKTRGYRSNGSKQELRAGDVVHIAAGTPYQMVLAGDKTLGCLVIRIKKVEEL